MQAVVSVGPGRGDVSKREFRIVYDFEASVTGSIVELKFVGIDDKGAEAELLDVFNSVRLLILDLLEANLSWTNLTEDKKNENLLAHLTLQMATQASIVVAAERARNHLLLLQGRKTLTACGFPEFDGHDYLDD
jgi:hypothetical protein